MLLGTQMLKDIGEKDDILSENTVNSEEIDIARKAYKQSLEDAMNVNPKDQKLIKSSPTDFDFFRKSSAMTSNTASVGKELQKISDNAIKNLKDKINADYTTDSELYSHNSQFVGKQMNSHNNSYNEDQKSIESLSTKFDSIDCDAKVKASIQIEIENVRKAIEKYNVHNSEMSHQSDIALNYAAHQHEIMRSANEKKSIANNVSDTRRYLEVEGNLLCKEARSLHVLSLDHAMCETSLEKLKERIDLLEHSHRTSQEKTEKEGVPILETVVEDGEKATMLPAKSKTKL